MTVSLIEFARKRCQELGAYALILQDVFHAATERYWYFDAGIISKVQQRIRNKVAVVNGIQNGDISFIFFYDLTDIPGGELLLFFKIKHLWWMCAS